MRLFVAVWPPPEILRSIADLDRPAVSRLRWTTPDQWHITLRFLGSVDDGLVAPLAEALGGPVVTAALGPTARLGGSVLVAPVAGLEDLAAAVLEATAPLVPLTEARPFRGHLTLARARRGSSVPASLAGVPLAGEWTVRRMALVASELHRDGARYRDVAAIDLHEGP